jgi:hypothetical protein
MRKPFIYYFYNEEGHIKLRYLHLNRLIEKGSIYLNKENRIFLNPFKNGVTRVWRIPNMSIL